ncbi:MAG: hypothetical protein PHY14_02180 [Candidatus Gracilibacteria bacterium]|nr:hypothetical protein [Candidatus Gracilibacteria bacterium]
MFSIKNGVATFVGIGGIIVGTTVVSLSEKGYPIEETTQASCSRILGGEKISANDWKNTVEIFYKNKNEQVIVRDILAWQMLLSNLEPEDPLYHEWQGIKIRQEQETKTINDDDTNEVRTIALKQLGELFDIGFRAYPQYRQQFCMKNMM